MLGRSTIIIARGLSLIENADFIVAMEDGQLMKIETHEELYISSILKGFLHASSKSHIFTIPFSSMLLP
ncbi:putative P-loop containing nucleoside triphosphate hydrolase [Helianthus annuus]|uniref:P-loop containing nucleoside triphosphate hydrolase n=1 Tax=Helianthus annuus TaxID=4232 RepID=A0A9K3NHD0_HELAN|nr:putative P-loop containing nucleoside triphosphate hydrolase [Helianthus annuus]